MGRERRAPWARESGAGPPWERWARPGRLPWASTLAVAVVQQAGSSYAALHQPGRAPLDSFARVLLAAGPAFLLLRHRHPVAAVSGACLAAALYLGGGYPYGPVFISVAVSCFTAVVAGHRRVVWSAVALLWAVHLLIAHWLYQWLPPAGDGPAGWGAEWAPAAWAAALLAAAELVRVRREQWAHARAEHAAAERRRADEERLRIARELHDVLAHSISVINVQAGVGLALIDSHPEQARTALTTIKAASKEALGEVRQVLDTLRAPGDAPRSPAPGLDRLQELTRQAAGAGLDVHVTTEGPPADLPPGAGLAAFRIVQEALTNIVRHSGSRTAEVLLHYGPDALEVTVDDEGPALSGTVSGGGNGLLGMRERAAALGGTAEAGVRPDGGFRVRARLPLRGQREQREPRGERGGTGEP
ncbi:sensor histidine kinase [Streptomyces sp. NPDC008001]|uniref:sensor histidine kinase n=1 Tax=Streptomyces sp. NPDC008001 TaxID=3364804 RepID=UPI0036E8B96F